MIFFSASTRGFYNDEVYVSVPDDAVELSQSEYLELLKGETDGLLIEADVRGRPVLKERPPLTAIQEEQIARNWRDTMLVLASEVRDRHRDELELGLATTLTADQFLELLGYIQKLRDWPAAEEFPAEESRPARPEWFKQKTS
ncbi:phage tail assembly chaperone [Pseudomonas corrugata]|uniref:tail fiber assembly protein n=1 Tax=Pseudomonas corrugata TaxID=47879 RepID=UPI003D814FD3